MRILIFFSYTYRIFFKRIFEVLSQSEIQLLTNKLNKIRLFSVSKWNAYDKEIKNGTDYTKTDLYETIRSSDKFQVVPGRS